MADCSAATAGYLEGVDSTRVQSRNCEAEDGEFGRSRGFVCSLPYFGSLCGVDLVDGPPQPVDTVANRRGISLLGAPNSTCGSWVGRNCLETRSSVCITNVVVYPGYLLSRSPCGPLPCYLFMFTSTSDVPGSRTDQPSPNLSDRGAARCW